MDIDVVLNGTLNFVFHQTASRGVTLAEACDQAIKLGYAEPGATDPLSLINGELRDVVMKVCVLMNTILLRGSIITPQDFTVAQVSAEDLEALAQRAASYRMMVSLSNRAEIKPGEFFKQGFTTTYSNPHAGNWRVRGGFRLVHHDPEFEWLPGGVGNGVCITEGELGSGGKYSLLGPGAGLEATTTAMINDAERLLEQRMTLAQAYEQLPYKDLPPFELRGSVRS
jgi:homoserine dehydrogenase